MNHRIIVIAGASGFVGRTLIERLLSEFPEAQIIGLSRATKESQNPRLQWRQCDLFSEVSIAKALPAKVDLVYYLVHSMEPTAKLDQGSFADYDLIMADNFARACRAKCVRQLVYLGGLLPEGVELSLHLQSRLEVESVFREHGMPYTFFRAGLILGEGGSSFEILLKLVKRLHVMICPTWTQTRTSPVDLPAVVRALVTAAKSDQHLGKVYDLAGCRPLTYLEMMRQTAEYLGVKRYFLKVPLFSPTLSRLWVSLITNTSKFLVYPLIESLQHPMVARDEHSFFPDSRSCSYSDLLQGIPTRLTKKPFRWPARRPRPTVRSVQRMPAKGKSAREVADAYFAWLPRLTKGLIAVVGEDGRLRLRLFRRLTLIELSKIPELSGDDRMTYAIAGGLLVRPCPAARLEFRLVLERTSLLVAIHDYAPALPWYVYRYTQALAHLLVMSKFRRSLYGG